MSSPQGTHGELRKKILESVGVLRQVTWRRKIVWALSIGLAIAGLVFVRHPAVLQGVLGFSDSAWDALGGALLGCSASLLVGLALSTEEEALAVMASSLTGSLSSKQLNVRPYQRAWAMFHPTRVLDEKAEPNRGFFWMRSYLDLSVPAAGKLFGLMKTVNPRTGEQIQYAVEGRLHRAVLTLIAVPLEDQNDSAPEAAFTFSVSHIPGDLVVGTATYETYVAHDMVLGPAFMCADDKVGKLLRPELAECALGRIPNEATGRMLDNKWWMSHSLKILPRALPQFSGSHTDVTDLEGTWDFVYQLVYGYDDSEWYTQRTQICKSGGRFVLLPVNADAGSMHPKWWIAELRAMHDYCLAGRWWAAREKVEWARETALDALTWDTVSAEGSLLVNIEPNDEGLTGVFTGHPSAHRPIARFVAARAELLAERRAQQVERLKRMSASTIEKAGDLRAH